MHKYTPAASIFDGAITNLLSILYILTEILSHAHAVEDKSMNDFKFDTFIGYFKNDGTASIATTTKQQQQQQQQQQQKQQQQQQL